MNSCNFIVRLVKDAELTYTPTGTAVCKFTGAVDKKLSKDKKAEQQSQGKPTADFPRFIAFGKTAETIANYTSKGTQIGLDTRFQSGSYKNQNGDTVFASDFVVEEITFVAKAEKQVVADDFSTGGFDTNDFAAIDELDSDLPF